MLYEKDAAVKKLDVDDNKFNKVYVINITVISWLPPLILQLFHLRFLKAAPFLYNLAVFV